MQSIPFMETAEEKKRERRFSSLFFQAVSGPTSSLFLFPRENTGTSLSLFSSSSPLSLLLRLLFLFSFLCRASIHSLLSSLVFLLCVAVFNFRLPLRPPVFFLCLSLVFLSSFSSQLFLSPLFFVFFPFLLRFRRARCRDVASDDPPGTQCLVSGLSDTLMDDGLPSSGFSRGASCTV